MRANRINPFCIIFTGIAIALMLCAGWWGTAMAQCGGEEYTSEFQIDACKFKSRGVNPYFNLTPGYQLYFEGEEDGETVTLLITVLNEKKAVDLPDYGKVMTRVVEEREWADGEIAEISRNYFAICDLTNDVYYFGEDVDIYEDGEIVSNEGSWLAGVDGATPGIVMPGTFLIGSRYYQENAPGVAEDLAKHIAMGLAVSTAAGDFENCVKVVETSALDCTQESIKFYCPGVGLVIDDTAELVDYGWRFYSQNGDENGDPAVCEPIRNRERSTITAGNRQNGPNDR